MYECKYCGSSDDVSRRYKVCSSCITLCVRDDERDIYLMDFTSWEKNKVEIKYREGNSLK